jgi:microsomal dipeptidase-like Zn-dependent dipeptidase
MSEKFTIIHADPQFGYGEHHRGEADFIDKDMAERGDYSNPEHSSLQRLSQFGVDTEALKQSGIDVSKLSAEDYDKLTGEAINMYFQTLIAAVYDEYMIPRIYDPSDPASAGPRMVKILEGIEGQKNIGIHAIKHGSEVDSRKTNMVFQLEGMDCVTGVQDVQKLFSADIRVFSPQYNKTNQIANNETGLTPVGKQVIEYLFQYGAIVDLAHSSLAVRRNILDMARDRNAGHLVSYTHGSTPEFGSPKWVTIAPERFITKPEVKEIIEMGGILGWGASHPFVSSLEHLSDLINETAQIEGGVSQVAIGADFGGVPNSMLLEGLDSVKDMANLGEVLSMRHNYSDEDIKLILQRNGTDWIKNALGRGVA